jgi:hypothetical protein
MGFLSVLGLRPFYFIFEIRFTEDMKIEDNRINERRLPIRPKALPPMQRAWQLGR